METNQNPVQEQSAQYITPENTQAEQQPVPSPEQPTGQLAPKPEPQPEQPTEKLYNPAEAAQIVQSLTEDYFNPEYILLFGKLVGGTRHSDAMTYDLLMVVRETPEYDWIQAKRILRYKVPYSRREITYINLYIMPLSYVESNKHHSSTLHTPRANCSIAATTAISAARNTRSTLPQPMRTPNFISIRSGCWATN